jgi:REP element-mobilizing transposase RayT
MKGTGDTLRPEPLAYFLTWTTYGTWLPGDDRGWVKRLSGIQAADESVARKAALRMTSNACRLSNNQRAIVQRTIVEHCRIRGWTLHVVNCRTNHVHVVVTANIEPKAVRDQLKAWCTRKLNECLQPDELSAVRPRTKRKWWTERGSCRYINHEDDLETAIVYVRDGQDQAR